MGVKRYFLLTIDGETYSGPAAYYRLRRYYEQFYVTDQVPHSFASFEAAVFYNIRGWRKRIPILWRYLRGRGLVGTLREAKTRNPLKDWGYRGIRDGLLMQTGYRQAPVE